VGNFPSSSWKTAVGLSALSAGALLVHGYHPFAEDAEIYLPGVEKILHPELFPVGQEFFLSHASLTFFPDLVALSLRVTHLPLETGLFLWHLASIFLLLLACWELGGVFFQDARARWGGVCLVAALLTIPVAGTALYIMDQYLNPRNLAAFAGIFMVARTLEKKYAQAILWLAFAACMHPLMWVFPFSFCVLFLVMEKFGYLGEKAGKISVAGLLWFGIPLAPLSSAAYHEVAKHHGYFYIQHWEWYEWLGIAAPLLLLWWFGRLAHDRQWGNIERVSRAFAAYGLIYVAMALVFDLPARLETLARLQPLRSLHLLYIVLFVMMGGFLGEYVLKSQLWRWLLLFVPLCIGMFLAQRSIFPASAQVEWPGASPRNPWAQSFIWIRENTPVNAVFALDPDYMNLAGEDEIGFRCLAQRSRLADRVKDDGVVSMFPQLAQEWWDQVQAETPWKNFTLENFTQLKKTYGASWVVLQQPGVVGLDCLHQNGAVQVCRIP
jgi:drug/metabolite transporter superfamily protein YnfA